MRLLSKLCGGCGAMLLAAAIVATGTDVYAFCYPFNACSNTCVQGNPNCVGICNNPYLAPAQCNSCACDPNPMEMNACQCL